MNSSFQKQRSGQILKRQTRVWKQIISKFIRQQGKGIEIKGKEFDLRRVLVRENRKIVMEKEDRITDETFADYRIEPEFYGRLVIQYRKKKC